MFRTSRLIFRAAVPLIFISASAFSQTSAIDRQLTAFEQKIERGQYAEVEKALMQFVIANQSSARGFQALARVRSNQDRPSEARGLYQKAIALDGRLVPSKLELALIELRLGARNAGLLHLNEVAQEQLSTEDRLKLAQTYIPFREFEAALKAISALPLQIQNSIALPIRAVCHLELGENEKLIALARLAERTAAKTPAVAVKFAETIAGTRFNKDAMRVLRSVVTAHPRDVAALLSLASVEIGERDAAAAEKHIRQAEALAPDSAEVLFGKAMLAAEQGDAKAALAHLEKAFAKAPNSVPIMREMVLAAMRTNQPPRAIEIARKLMAVRPSEPEFVYLYGAANLQIGRFNEAEVYLTRYVGIRSQDPRACVALGIALVSQPAKLAEGHARLEQCLSSDPNNFEAAFQLGLSLKGSGESERAIALFEQALRVSPDFVPALRELGTLQLQAGQTAKARVSLEKAVALDPKDANTHFQLSRLYNLAGEPDLARIHFEKFQSLRVTN